MMKMEKVVARVGLRWRLDVAVKCYTKGVCLKGWIQWLMDANGCFMDRLNSSWMGLDVLWVCGL